MSNKNSQSLYKHTVPIPIQAGLINNVNLILLSVLLWLVKARLGCLVLDVASHMYRAS